MCDSHSVPTCCYVSLFSQRWTGPQHLDAPQRLVSSFVPKLPLHSHSRSPRLAPSYHLIAQLSVPPSVRRVPARGRPAFGWQLCFYFTRSAFCFGLTLGVFRSFSCIGSPQSATPWRKPGRSVCSRYPVRVCIVCGAFCVCASTIRHTREPDQVWLAAA